MYKETEHTRLHHIRRSHALTPEDKANVFNQFFCSVFNKRIDTVSSIPGHGCDYSSVLPVHLINDLICTPSEAW